MRRVNRHRITLVVAASAVVLGVGVAAWAQQLEVKKDTWLATTGGNVGIGTTTPAQKLEIYEGKLQVTRSAGYGPQIYMKATGSGGGEWQITSTNDAAPSGGGNLIFSSPYGGTQEVMTGAGNMGIGTLSPQARLEVAGVGDDVPYLRITSAGNYYTLSDIEIDSSTDRDTGIQFSNRGVPRWNLWVDQNTGGLDPFYFRNGAGTNVLTIEQSGNVGIGTSAPDALLTVNGNADAVAWNQLSSRSYKEQIRRVSKKEQRKMLDTLMRMKPSRYKYKPRFGDEGRERLGFIAEEMPKEVLAKNGKAVDLYELQTLTIAALKEQQREFDHERREFDHERRAQDRRITALRAQVARLAHALQARKGAR